MAFQLRLKNDELVTFNKPIIMGIINLSPNSFFNPQHSLEAALLTAERMIHEGADILDIGGEATNPQVDIVAAAPALDVELQRVIPVIKAIKKKFNVLVSVDTSQAQVMQEAVSAGADMINDQRALREPGALRVASQLKTPVCLMHFFQQPRTPGSGAMAALLQQIITELMVRVEACLAAGIGTDRIILDPGFGQGNYAKSCAENFYLLAALNQFVQLGYPLLVGWSRKSMLGDVLGNVPPQQRLFASVAAETLATYLGAHILRTHDVQAGYQAALIARQILDESVYQ